MTTIVVVLGLIMAIVFYKDLDKLLASTGVVFGTFVVLFVPSLCHYKLLATSEAHGTSMQKKIDVFIMGYSIIMAVGVLTF